MVSNCRQIKIAEDAYLDVTCEEWQESGGKYRSRSYGQVARGRAFGNWATCPWEHAEPNREKIAEAVSAEMRRSNVVVDRVEFESIESPVFIFKSVPKPEKTR